MTTTAWPLEAVAEAYRAGGRRPVEHVAEVFGVSRAHAGRRIDLARRQGLLPPARPGTTSNPSDKLRRIAEALGVDVDQLRQVVLDVADGDLRIR